MRKLFSAASLSAISLSALFAPAPLIAQPNSPDLRCMEGVYELEESKIEGEVFRPPQVSGRRLGHSTTGITMDLYQHVMPGMQEDAAAQIDAAYVKAIAGPKQEG